MRATELVEKERSLLLAFEDGHRSEFHYVWLRDNCRCPRCRSPQTFERVSFTGDIPLDISPREARLTSAGSLEIVWDNDGMASSFPGDWLHAHRYAPGARDVEAASPEFRQTLWGGELNGRIPTFSYNEVVGSDGGLLAWIEALAEYGVVLTRGVPTDPRPDLDPPGETRRTRLAVRAACGAVERFANHVACVRQDAFDSGTADMKVDPGGYAQALTPIPLPLHTDVPCFDWPPGVLMLHCLQPAESGGESVFVDGFHIAERLRAEHPEAFEVLSTVPVAFKLASPRRRADRARADARARRPGPDAGVPLLGPRGPTPGPAGRSGGALLRGLPPAVCDGDRPRQPGALPAREGRHVDRPQPPHRAWPHRLQHRRRTPPPAACLHELRRRDESGPGDPARQGRLVVAKRVLNCARATRRPEAVPSWADLY